jgi:glycosyltransferase involved in cell wall biosynthesis
MIAKDGEPGTVITIVVPVLNEEELLPFTLASIHSQAFKNYEVIVVDNGSTDRSPEIGRAFADRFLVEPERGPIHAMHRGILNAKGRFVTCCDADTIYPPHWLERMVRRLQHRGVVAVHGPIAFRENGPVLRILTLIGYCILAWLSRLFGVSLAGGANLGIRRDAYFACGGYELESDAASQDFRLLQRLSKFGKVHFSPMVACYTSNRRFMKVNFWHGLREAFWLWWDVARGTTNISYERYYADRGYSASHGRGPVGREGSNEESRVPNKTEEPS